MKCKTCGKVILTKDLSCPYCEYGSDSAILNEDSDENLTHEEKPKTFSKYSRKRRYEGKRGLFALIYFYKQMFNFNGEADWLEYWTQQLYLILIATGYSILRFAHLDPTTTLPPVGQTILVSLAILIIVSALPYLSSTARRLRNAGYSPYLVLLVFVPIIGNLILLILTLAPAE